MPKNDRSKNHSYYGPASEHDNKPNRSHYGPASEHDSQPKRSHYGPALEHDSKPNRSHYGAITKQDSAPKDENILDNYQAIRAQAEQQLKQKDMKGAITTALQLTKAPYSAMETFTTKMLLAHLYMTNKEYTKSIETYKAINRWEDQISILNGITRCYIELKEFHAIVDLIKASIYWDNTNQCMSDRALKQKNKQQVYNQLKLHFIHSNIKITDYTLARKLIQDNDALAYQCELGYLLQQEDNHHQAIKVFEKAINKANKTSHHSKNAQDDYYEKKMLCYLGFSYKILEQFDSAIDTYEKVYPWEIEVYEQVTSIYIETQQFDKAKQTLLSYEGWESHPQLSAMMALCDKNYAQHHGHDNVGYLFEQAHKLVQEGLYNEAIQMYQNQLPQNERNQLAQANCHLKMDNYPEVIRLFNEQPHLISSNRGAGRVILASAWLKIGEYERVIALIESYPSWRQSTSLVIILTRTYEALKKNKEAWETINVKEQAEHPEIISHKAALCHQTGRFQDAITYYKKLKTLTPFDLKTMSDCLQKTGHGEEAEEMTKQLYASDSVHSVRMQVSDLIDRKECEKALSLLDTIPTDRHTTTQRINIYLTLRRYIEAYELFKTIPAIHMTPKIIERWGTTAVYLGRTAEARAKFKEIPNWETSYLALERIAISYEEDSNYAQAILTLKQIPQWEQMPSTLLRLARYQRECGLVDEAIQLLTDSSNMMQSPADLQDLNLLLATCYALKQDLTTALFYLQDIPNYQNDRAILSTTARIYENAGAHREARACHESNIQKYPTEERFKIQFANYLDKRGETDEALTLLNTRKNNNSLLMIKTKAAFLEKMYRFDDALALYQEALRLEPLNTEIRLCVTFCHDAKGDIEQAIATIHAIPQWYTIPKVLTGLANIYLKNDDAALALSTYERVPDYQNNLKVMLSRAIVCSHYLNNPIRALAILNEITSGTKEISYLLTSARIHLELHQKDIALSILHSVPNWQMNKAIMITLASLYRASHQYTDALNTYHQILNWENDPDVILALQTLYEMQTDDEQMQAYYERWCKNFKNHQELHYRYCRFAVTQKLTIAEKVLESTRARWPISPRLSLLAAEQAGHQHSVAEKIRLLNELLKQYPYFQEAHVALIKTYLSIDLAHEANMRVQICLESFNNNKSLFKIIDKLYVGKALLKVWGSDYQVDITHDNDSDPDKKQHTIDLTLYRPLLSVTNRINRITQAMGNNGEKFFIVGSSVRTCIDGLPLGETQDIDIAYFGQCHSQFNKEGFDTCIYHPNLYQMNEEQHAVDCYVLNHFSDINQISDQFVIDAIQQYYGNNQYNPLKNNTIDAIKEWFVNYYNDILDTSELSEMNAEYIKNGMEPLIVFLNKIYSDFLIHRNALTRGYTIDALFLNPADGSIHDPSLKGLKHHRTKTLSFVQAIDNPYAKNPILILRGIRHMVSGYKPNTQVTQALHNWNPDGNFPDHHFKSSLIKYLSRSDINPVAFVSKLIQFNLLNKIAPNLSYDSEKDAVRLLKKKFMEPKAFLMSIQRYKKDATRAYHQQDFCTAITKFSAAIELDPQNQVLQFALGRAHYMNHAYMAAAEAYKPILMFDHINDDYKSIIHYNIGVSFALGKALPQAQTHFALALAIKPDDVIYQQNLRLVKEALNNPNANPLRSHKFTRVIPADSCIHSTQSLQFHSNKRSLNAAEAENDNASLAKQPRLSVSNIRN